MRAGQAYKHENCTDSFIEVIKIQYYDEKRVKARVLWWTQGQTKCWPTGHVETIEIQRQDLPKWKEFTPYL